MTLDTTPSLLNRLAESYVKLVLSVGLHDADYVDAYYGPPAWKSQVESEKPDLNTIMQRATTAVADLAALSPGQMDESTQLRHQYLLKQTESLVSRVSILAGAKLSFDEESRSLYDAVAPTYAEEHFRHILRELGKLLPGTGPVHRRFEAYKERFVIPKGTLDTVFQAAIKEARSRTRRVIELPAEESFTLEYVTGKSWSGYNWYKGSSHSLIQINTDLPIFIDRAIDLASHEGYPGHHVYNLMLERTLVNGRRWVEFSVYALFSPQSLIAEGTANYGIEMAFPGKERAVFERDVLFPLAGLDASETVMYYRIHALFQQLAYAGNEAARKYLDGLISRDDAARWLTEYALMSPERAQQRTRFFDQYRSYVINYNLGQEIVGRYLQSKGGTPDSPARRWQLFAELLSTPRVPSALVVE